MTPPAVPATRTADRLRAWIRRSAAALVGATIVAVTLNWPGLGDADQHGYLAAGTLLGLTLGAFWQAVDRRDLADRSVLLSFGVIATGLLPATVGGNYRPGRSDRPLRPKNWCTVPRVLRTHVGRCDPSGDGRLCLPRFIASPGVTIRVGCAMPADPDNFSSLSDQ